jgi:UDP-glucose:(heptosyl)LPS alpha-1,3-glucosyltransferase
MAAPMTLAFLLEHFDPAGGGAEQDAVALCRALVARGHRLHVIAEDAAPLPGITVHLGLSRAGEHLAAIAPDLSIDWGLYHPANVHRIGGGIHAAFLPYNLASYPPPLRWWKALSYRSAKHRRTIARERALLTNPHASFLAISRFVAEHAIAHGAVAEAVTVLHNAIDPERFAPDRLAPQRTAARAAWAIPEEAVVLLFVAHNLRLKNLALLQRVVGRLAARWPHLRLLVVGKRQPAWQAPWLIAPGPLADMAPAYAAADLLVHPSYFDSFANVVLEAMSAGLPPLVSDCTGASEVITPNHDGLVLPVTTAHADDAWHAALEELLAEPADRLALGAAARATALRHDYAAYVERLEQFLRAALARRARG